MDKLDFGMQRLINNKKILHLYKVYNLPQIVIS